MCLIIAKRHDGIVTDLELEIGFVDNPNGAGFAYVNNNDRVVICKPYTNLTKLTKAIRRVESQYPDSPILIHFRLATSGLVDSLNAHPMYVTKDLAFAHNGIFSSFRLLAENDRSDTYTFNQLVLKPIMVQYGNDGIHNKGIQQLLLAFCEKTASKLVFLGADKRLTVFNHTAGKWNEDQTVWYSSDISTDVLDYSYTHTHTPLTDYMSEWTYPLEHKEEQCTICGSFYPLHQVQKIVKGNYLFDTLCDQCWNFISGSATCVHCGSNKLDHDWKLDLFKCRKCHKTTPVETVIDAFIS